MKNIHQQNTEIDYTNCTKKSILDKRLSGSGLFYHYVRVLTETKFNLSEDIDILILEADRKKWNYFLLNKSLLEIYYVRRRSYVDTYYFKDGNYFFQLDLEWNLSWHGVEILKSKSDFDYLNFFDKISSILRPILWGGFVNEKYYNEGLIKLKGIYLINYELNNIIDVNPVNLIYSQNLVSNRISLIKKLKTRDILRRDIFKYLISRIDFFFNEVSLFLFPIGFIIIMSKKNDITFLCENQSKFGRTPWSSMKPLSFNNFSFKGLRDGDLYFFKNDILYNVLKKLNKKKIYSLIKLSIIKIG